MGGGGDFFDITERTKLDYFKKHRYTRSSHTAKIHTLFEASGLKRNPAQDA